MAVAQELKHVAVLNKMNVLLELWLHVEVWTVLTFENSRPAIQVGLRERRSAFRASLRRQ